MQVTVKSINFNDGFSDWTLERDDDGVWTLEGTAITTATLAAMIKAIGDADAMEGPTATKKREEVPF